MRFCEICFALHVHFVLHTATTMNYQIVFVSYVETLANIDPLINNGADWFKSIGTYHKEDRDKPIRRSYENKSIKKIYDEYLDAPGSEKAHHLLHTEYSSRAKY